MTISSSASAGMPGMPSRLDHSPSCMWPPAARASSSQCWARVTPRAEAYSRARRISRASCTPAPSSVNSRTPRAAISASGASCVPGPADGDGAGHRARRSTAPAPRSSTWRTTAARVDGRLGVGHGHDRGVAAEGGRPGARSRPSRPPPGPARAGGCGGRPGRGRRRSPPASRTTVPAGPALDRRPDRRRSRRRGRATSARRLPGRVDDGAAPDDHGGGHAAGRRRSGDGKVDPRAEQQVEHRHAHGHAVGHLVGDDRVGQVGHLGGDLDAPVHRPGVHDQGVVGQQPGPVAGEPVAWRCTRAATGAAPRSSARAAAGAGRRRRARAGPRRGRGRPRPASPRATAAAGSAARPGSPRRRGR